MLKLYHLIFVSQANIPNFRSLGPPLYVAKFVWCKVILVFALAKN